MQTNSWTNRIAQFVRSRTCFRLIIAFFCLESAWIALSASYPMAFDEDFHFGIIKLYARQWSPFFTHQPAGGDAFGALTSDPSYLYHYLMSFPYRLTELFTHSQMVQIIALRLIDVALVAVSLVLFRRVLLKTKAPSGLVNVVLLFFSLVPVVPLLAAQINYDDLLMPLTALAVLLAMQLKERLDSGTVPVALCLGLAAVCMLASLVQFEFLPIFVAIVLYDGYHIWQFKRRSRRLQSAMRHSWRLLRHTQRFAYAFIFLLALGLFGGRYGSNLVAYKSPVPQCNQVLSVSQCSAYSPWLRNYTDELNRSASTDLNPLRYSENWLYGMFTHSFFVSSSGADAAAFYVHVSPLPVISVTALAILGGGLILFCYYRKSLLREYPLLGFLLFVGGFYCLVLWAWNYHDFVHLGAAVALNGRYLFPILPPLMLAIGLAYYHWLRNRPQYKVALLAVTLVLFLQGGGALTFIDASNSHWYWHNRFSQDINAAAQKIVKPLTIS